MMMRFLILYLIIPQLSWSRHVPVQRDKRSIRDGVWSEWTKWTDCSRDCGGGVSSRTRNCFPPSTMSFRGRGLQPVDEERCRGRGKDRRLCNLHRCPSSTESFRSQQCAKFNHIPYQGKFYSWESTENDRSLCALDCRTKERPEITTRMADMVVDGTRCRRNSLDVCISGTCVKVGCDLKLDSDKRVDACGVCGGNGTSCLDSKAVFIWEETPLSHCSVPCGGGFMMARPVCINARTLERVLDDLCDTTSRPNERMAPCNQDACPARWEVGDWQSCSKACGGGLKERNVSCIIDKNGGKVKVLDKECLDLKPPSKEGCNSHDCPQWFTGLWSECSVSCGKGTRHRNVICRDERGSPSGACDYSIRPAVSQVCYTPCSKDLTSTESEDSNHKEDGQGWIRLEGEDTLSSSLEVENAQEAEEDTQPFDSKTTTTTTTTTTTSPSGLSPQPPQGLLQGASDPTFIVEEWGSCSSPCGEGIRQRKVECKIFLEFSKTIAVLPDKECPGPKPPLTEVCYSGLCDGDSSSSVSNIQSDNGGISPSKRPSYSWKDAGFTTCSESCLGGIQESKIICVEDELEAPVAPNNCPISSRPEIIVRTCNDHPCPPRWNVSDFSECSKSCGGGIQIRSVSCIQEVRHGGNNILRVNDSLCPQPPPITQQFCNVLDCPIKWTFSAWTKCSSSCGGGYKFRKVRCQQLLALGEMADKPEMQCSGRKPEEQRLCNPQSCPEVTGIYSKFHYEKDHLDVDTHRDYKRKQEKEEEVRMPSIKAHLNQNYIQTDPSKKTIKLKVGGKATVYAGTKLKIRCPVKKFDRRKIQWSHNNSLIKPMIHKSKAEKRKTNVFVTKKGGLRIKRTKLSDSGIYTCLAKGSTATIEIVVHRLPDDYSNDSIKWKKYGHAVNKTGISSKDLYYDKDRKNWDPHKLWVTEKNSKVPHQTSNMSTHEHNLYMRFNSVKNGNEKSWDLEDESKERSSSDYYDWESDASAHQKKLYNQRKHHSSHDYVDHPEYEDNTEIVAGGEEMPLKLQWQTTEWTSCSQTCGIGGSQVRKVRCVVIQGHNVTEVPKDICVDSGLSSTKPDAFRKCVHSSPCPKWLAEPWVDCELNSKCISRGKALQTRKVHCGYTNNYKSSNKERDVGDHFCEAIFRPKATRQCHNLRCEGIWHVGTWSECSASCGYNGTETRVVKCKWKTELEASSDSIDDSYCEHGLPKPLSSQPCSQKGPCIGDALSASSSLHINRKNKSTKDCQDESEYCGLVYSFNLCNLPKYKKKCCNSCSIAIRN